MPTKRIAALLLAAVLTLPLSGCGTEEAADGTITVYRLLSAPDTATGEMLGSEEIPCGEDPFGTAVDALNADKVGNGLVSPMSSDAEILTAELSESTAVLTMDQDYWALSSLKRTLINSCITLTLCALDGVESVTIQGKGKDDSLHLSEENVMLYNTETDPYELEVRLYYPDSTGRYLSVERRVLSLDRTGRENLPRYVMEELLRGSSGEAGGGSAIPAGTGLLSLETAGGLCTADLSGEFVENQSDDPITCRLAAYAVINTLTALNDIELVQLLCRGETMTDYGGMDLSSPMARSEAVIADSRENPNRLDMNVYVVLSDGARIAAIPALITQPENEAVEKAAVDYLLCTMDEPAYVSVLPFGAWDARVSIRGGSCTLDLPTAFYAGFADTADFAQAGEVILATLRDLSGIRTLIFTREGEVYRAFLAERLPD